MDYILLEIKAMFGLLFFIIQFPLLITQNILPIWHHHSLVITQYFSHYLWVPYLSHGVGNFFFHSVSSNPVKNKTEQQTQEKKGKKKKKVKSSQKVQLVLFVGPLCVFNHNIVIEL